MKVNTSNAIGAIGLTIVNLGLYIAGIFFVLRAIKLEVVDDILPVYVAPVFGIGLVALLAAVLFTKLVLWFTKEFVFQNTKKS